jgi:hypothetical protein
MFTSDCVPNLTHVHPLVLEGYIIHVQQIVLRTDDFCVVAGGHLDPALGRLGVTFAMADEFCLAVYHFVEVTLGWFYRFNDGTIFNTEIYFLRYTYTKRVLSLTDIFSSVGACKAGDFQTFSVTYGLVIALHMPFNLGGRIGRHSTM